MEMEKNKMKEKRERERERDCGDKVWITLRAGAYSGSTSRHAMNVSSAFSYRPQRSRKRAYEHRENVLVYKKKGERKQESVSMSCVHPTDAIVTHLIQTNDTIEQFVRFDDEQILWWEQKLGFGLTLTLSPLLLLLLHLLLGHLLCHEEVIIRQRTIQKAVDIVWCAAKRLWEKE
jgi:hypothetical protein